MSFETVSCIDYAVHNYSADDFSSYTGDYFATLPRSALGNLGEKIQSATMTIGSSFVANKPKGRGV
jgi:hypothetical protein